MSWAARGARAGALSALAVGWGLLAHLGAAGHDGGAGTSVGTLLWAASATLLLTWWLAPRRPGGGSAGRVARLVLSVGAGQGLTHAALALTPLLAGRTRMGPVLAAGPADHAGHVPAVVVGTPGPAELLAALGHGGSAMLLLHALASTTVVVLWTAAGALWREAVAWWGRLVDSGSVRVPPQPRWPAAHRDPVTGGSALRVSWDGRAPPAPALP